MSVRFALFCCVPLLAPPLLADIYRWNGSVSSDWNTAANWTAAVGLASGPAPTNGNFAPGHRLEVYNGAGNPLVYTAALGTTEYPNTTGGFPRALVVGNGTAGAMRIEGGVFSTLGATGQDILAVGVAGSLTVAGGEYRSANLFFGNAAGGTGTFTLQSGAVLLSTLTFNHNAPGAGTVNLDGGILSLGNLVRGAVTGTQSVRLNGGTLRATGANAALSGLTTVEVRDGGAVIDSNGFNLNFSNALLHSAEATDQPLDGGLRKQGAGTLTLSSVSTFTGPITLEQGGLVLQLPLASTGLVAAAGTRLRLNAGGGDWNPATFQHGGGAMDFNFGGFGGDLDGLVHAGSLVLDGDVTVNLEGAGLPAGDIVLMTFGARAGAGTFLPGTLPVGASGTLEDTGTELVWRLTSPSVNSLTWSIGDGVWQTGGGANWNGNTAVYQEYGAYGDLVNFSNGTSGTVAVGGAVRPLALTVDTATAYTFAGSGSLVGPARLTKTGAGIATLQIPTAQTGTIQVSGGALVLAASSAATGTVTVANGAAFALSGGVTTTNTQAAVITGPGPVAANVFFPGSAVQRGAITSVSGTNTFAGTIVFSGVNTRVGVQDGAALILDGALTESAPGTILNIRAGNTPGSDVILRGAGNAWTGSTDIFSGGGMVRLGRGNVLPSVSVLRVGTSGIPGFSMLDLNGFDHTVAGLSQVALDEGAFIENNGASPSTLTLDPKDTQTYFHSIRDGLSQVRLVKTGIATQILAGVCAYTGDTTVLGGELSLGNPFLADTSDVHLSGSARLHLNFTGTNSVDELRLDGQPRLAGTWGGAGSGAEHVDAVRFRGPGLLRVLNGPTPTAYQAWAAANGLSGDAGREHGEMSDPDADGWTNGAEFALNLAPRSAAGADRIRVAHGLAGGQPHLLLTLPVRDGASFAGTPILASGAVDGVVYRLEGGAEIGTYPDGVEEVTGPDASAARAGLPALDAGWSYRTFRLLPGASARPRGVIRWSTGAP